MLKELLAIFQRDSKLEEAFQKSYEMLNITRDMFLEARRSLRETADNQLDAGVHKQDKKVNKFERSVRKGVFQHLAIAGSENLASGLTLISIIIDIERIGDYTKNIVELAENHPGQLHAGDRESDLLRVETAVEQAFGKVRSVLETSDPAQAEAFIKDFVWVNPLCDERVKGYVSGEDSGLSGGDTAALALYFRFLKRIHSHLRNLTTSVYRPFHKIGFVPKKVKGRVDAKD
jgi:Na+/phosphate symporter